MQYVYLYILQSGQYAFENYQIFGGIIKKSTILLINVHSQMVVGRLHMICQQK